MKELFSGLNPNQKEAVETVNGRLLVLAGAGSGKTRVLTLRIAYLIKKNSVSPKSILGLTFTNKAAAEMRHRLATLVEPLQAKQVTLCTFHSFCMQVLRNEIECLGYTPNFTLYDEKDIQRLLSAIARDILNHEGIDLPSLAPTTEMIASAKNRGLTPEEITGTGSTWHDGFVKDLYKRLQDGMRACNAVDFDSLLSLTVELFEKHPEVLEKYQTHYRYIMIDEYQDTNPIQYRLASLLAAKYQDLCVVGDDDQSIYGWRGADVQNILGFDQAKVIKLEQNYRSTNTILKAANAVISHNIKRHGKTLWSAKEEGELIEVFHAPSEEDEAQAVIYRMDKLRMEKGLRWGDVAILYRSNALARPFELALMKYNWSDEGEWIRGVPYQVFGGTEFYERREVRDLLAYLRVIVNPLDEEALLRIINYPRRGIGDVALDQLTACNRSQQRSLWSVLQQVAEEQEKSDHSLPHKISSQALHGVKRFLAILKEAKERFASFALADSLRWLVEEIDYKKAIAEEVKSDQMRTFKWENVEALIANIEDYQQQHAHQASLHSFVLSMPLNKDWNSSTKAINQDFVTLMTFHSAKGLEFPACFLVGMEDHIIPHEKSLKETGIEEERRLMYVAITRAKQYLIITMARQRKRKGVEMASQPSRFLLEIPKEYLKVTKWDM